jgi:transcriptional regulator with XRE-family HTH domain
MASAATILSEDTARKRAALGGQCPGFVAVGEPSRLRDRHKGARPKCPRRSPSEASRRRYDEVATAIWTSYPVPVHRESLARNLKALRSRHGLSQAELASATGMSSSFLSLVEQGKSEITIGRLIRLAEFFDVELPDLIGGEPSKPAGHVVVLEANSSNVIHSQQEGVDVYDLSAGTRWNLIATLGVHQSGGAVNVDEPHQREALIFVLEGTFELAFADEAPIRLTRGQGAIYLSTGPYRVTNVAKGQGRVLAVGLHADHTSDRSR